MNRVTMGLSVAAALLPLVATPSATAALDPPLPSPATVLFHTPIAGTMNTTLQGSLCRTPNTCVNIPYVPFVQLPFFPIFSTGTNVDTIENAVNSTPGQKILYGYSGGAQTVTEWLRANADDPEAPSPDDLTVLLLANPSRKYGGINAPGSVTPDTQYHVVDVTRQYDYNSDYPTDRFNLLAAANIAAGFFVIHLDYSNVDLNDPNNVVRTEGNTTYVFVPTKNIPLLEGLRMIGLTDLADQWNEPLKAMIEQAYDRSYVPVTASEPVTKDARAVAASMSSPEPVARAFASPAAVGSGEPKPVATLSPAPTKVVAESNPTATGVAKDAVIGDDLADTAIDTKTDADTRTETETGTNTETEAETETNRGDVEGAAIKHPAAQKPAGAIESKPSTLDGSTTDGYVGKHRKVGKEPGGPTNGTGDERSATGEKPPKDKDADSDRTSGRAE